MRILVVDDEAAARRRLVGMLGEMDEEVVGEAQDGLEALARARELKPDVILLDIAMPEVDGLDVAAHLAEPRPLVVFQTAYDEYALQAFEREALDYVLKPVTRPRLERAMERARQQLVSRNRPELSAAWLEQMRGLLGAADRAPKRRVLVRDRAGHRLLPLREVLRFHVDQGLVYAQTTGDRHATDLSLGQLEARTRGQFVQVSRSDLVNLEHIERLVASGDGSLTLSLSDGTPLRVSRRRAAEVRRELEG